MGRVFAAAAAAFEETLEGLDLPPEARRLDQRELGRRAALLAMADAVWGAHLGPLLDAKEVRRILGVGTRQAVSDLARRRRLLALRRRDGRVVYPAFQFGAHGRPHEALPRILAIVAPHVDPWTIASWFRTPSKLLGGASPARWLELGRDPERVLEAARRTAARMR